MPALNPAPALALLLFLVLPPLSSCKAQPYFDIGGISSWYIPAEMGNSKISEVSGNAFIALPVNIGKRNKLIFCPLFESRWMEYETTGKDFRVGSLSMLLVWRHESRDSIWTITTTLLPRTNSSNMSVNTTTLQPGCAVIGSYKVNPTLKFKLGLYYNTEYFGGYFMPLVGLDWKINNRWNLFGVLPNTMKLEYKINKTFYTGLSFKTITNSYRYENSEGYMIIRDNHLCLFTDIYLGGKITLMAEAGHTLFKEFNSRESFAFSAAGGDSFIFKTGIFYRIRLN